MLSLHKGNFLPQAPKYSVWAVKWHNFYRFFSVFTLRQVCEAACFCMDRLVKSDFLLRRCIKIGRPLTADGRFSVKLRYWIAEFDDDIIVYDCN